MKRRLFDHLFVEVSVEVGQRIPRYALWLRLHDLGCDPEALSVEEALAFFDVSLDPFLEERGFWIAPRSRRRLRKSIARFDPARRTPEEVFARWGRSDA